MIDGFILGVMAFISLVMTWHSLPLWAQRFIVNHPFVADSIAGISTWMFLTAVSKTIVAVVASFVTALMVNFAVIAYKAWKPNEH